MKWDSSSSDELLDEERRGTEERLWSSIESCCSTGGGLGRTGSWRSKLQRWKAVERMEMPRRRERERERMVLDRDAMMRWDSVFFYYYYFFFW